MHVWLLFSFLSFSGSPIQSNIKLRLNTAGVLSTSQLLHTQHQHTSRYQCSSGIFSFPYEGLLLLLHSDQDASRHGSHKPEGCSEHNKIRKLKHQKEGNLVPLNILTPGEKSRLYLPRNLLLCYERKGAENKQ